MSYGRNAASVRTALLPAIALALAACEGPQSTLDPQGPVAERIATTWWVMAIGALVVLVVVMALLFHAIWSGPAGRPRWRANVLLSVAGIAVPSLLLGALLVFGTGVGRSITQPDAGALRIEVIGHRWWWEVRYPRADGSALLTANELWLPAGVPVEVVVTSADVIHSFWIPRLAGKMDMVPGSFNALRLLAIEPGQMRMQCAEFCGAQHAHMGMRVSVVTPPQFEAWLQQRSQPAVDLPQAAVSRFLALGCGECHRIDGSEAGGTSAPVLTHFASRPSIGGAAAAMDGVHLRRWLPDHGAAMKPGSRGPVMRQLAPADVEQLARLLEALH